MFEDTLARIPRTVARYATSIAALIVAAALTLLIIHFKIPRQFAGYAFLLVIIGSAWWGGYGPGLLTTAMTFVFGPYLTQPNYTLRHVNLASTPQVVLISVLISRMAQTRERLRESNELLDERVRQRTTELQQANRVLQEREAMLLRQAEELSQSNADLEQFAYVASHDLQEPLRMIAIYTEMLQQRSAARFDADSARFMDTVLEGVRRMERLVHDLLTYSRTIHSEVAEPSEIDSGDALRAALLNLEPQIQASGAIIESDGLPVMVGDRGRLTQIFQNLIGNALKYRASDAPHIVIRAERNSDQWIFSVRDNGIGIHADYHEMIFNPFKRLHGHHYPGSGVGLAICRRIIERAGGRIWVDSEPEHGATFFFSIPIVEPHKSLAQHVESAG